MDWDDDFDTGHDDIAHGAHRDNSMPEKNLLGGLDPLDITNPASAYLFLSDDAQDEINGSDKKNMKCLSCSYRFMGDIYDRCPKCESLNTEEVLSFTDHDEGGESDNMRCLSCGQTFFGEMYDRCPECFSMDTEEIGDETNEVVSLFE